MCRMKGGYNMKQRKMTMKRHILVANKLLACMSGLNRKTKQDDGRYYYEKHALGLAQNFLEIKWTASLMKQVLAYVSKCNSQGYISLLSEQELATSIQCSVRTIQNNNKLLEQHGIIQWDRLWGEYIQVNLSNYLENFLDLYKKEKETTADETPSLSTEHPAHQESFEGELDSYTSKSGYTSISDEVMYLLFEIKNVNVLRMGLRALFAYEKDVNVKKDTEALLSYSEIKHVLPNYIGYKAAIKKMAAQLNQIFHVEILEKHECVREFFIEKQPKKSIVDKIKDGFIMSINLTGSRDSKQQRFMEKIMGEHLFYKFESFFKSYGRYDIKKDDIHALVHEFGLNLVEKALNAVKLDLHKSALENVESFHTILSQMESSLHTYIRKIVNGYYQAKITA